MDNKEERRPVSERPPEQQPFFVWCAYCQRVYLTETWQRAGWDCPGEGCSGNAASAHGWETQDSPRNAHPEYPEYPKAGGYYPLSDPEPGRQIGEVKS